MSWLPPFSRAGTVRAPSRPTLLSASPLSVPARTPSSSGGRASGGTRSGSWSISACSRRFHSASSSADGAVPDRPRGGMTGGGGGGGGGVAAAGGGPRGGGRGGGGNAKVVLGGGGKVVGEEAAS